MVGFSQIIFQEFLSGERSINGLSNFSSISTEEIERMIATPMDFFEKKKDFLIINLKFAAAHKTLTILPLLIMILFLK